MSSIDEYSNVVNEFGRKAQEKLGENFASYVIFGGLARGEIALGWSDIDSVLVVKEWSQEAKQLSDSIKAEVEQGHQWLLSHAAPTRLFVWVVDIGEFTKGGPRFISKLDLIDLKKTAKTITGIDMTQSISDVGLGNARDDIVKWFKFYRNELKAMRDRTVISKGINSVAYVITCARFSILVKQVYVVRKEEILREFEKLYPMPELRETLYKALNYRSNWPVMSSSVDPLEAFYLEALDFMDRLNSIAFEDAV